MKVKRMERRLIINGNAVFELDEACMLTKQIKDERKEENTHTNYSNRYAEEFKKANRIE